MRGAGRSAARIEADLGSGSDVVREQAFHHVLADRRRSKDSGAGRHAADFCDRQPLLAR
jgi:hypothetical protein